MIQQFFLPWAQNSKRSPDPLIYLQVIEPTEKAQGKYSIMIVDPENSHKRTLDLSGEGAALSVSHHLHTRSLTFPSIRRSSPVAQTQAVKSWQSFTEKPLGSGLLQWVPLGGWKHVSVSQRTPQLLRCSAALFSQWSIFSLFLLHYASLADIY